MGIPQHCVGLLSIHIVNMKIRQSVRVLSRSVKVRKYEMIEGRDGAIREETSGTLSLIHYWALCNESLQETSHSKLAGCFFVSTLHPYLQVRSSPE